MSSVVETVFSMDLTCKKRDRCASECSTLSDRDFALASTSLPESDFFLKKRKMSGANDDSFSRRSNTIEWEESGDFMDYDPAYASYERPPSSPQRWQGEPNALDVPSALKLTSALEKLVDRSPSTASCESISRDEPQCSVPMPIFGAEDEGA